MIGVKWMHEHSYRCKICALPRFFIRRDHTECLYFLMGALQHGESPDVPALEDMDSTWWGYP